MVGKGKQAVVLVLVDGGKAGGIAGSSGMQGREGASEFFAVVCGELLPATRVTAREAKE